VGDIIGCFDNLRHDTVVEILSHSIQDNRFLKLVKGMLRAGYMEDWVYHKTMSGAPQGGIISPLLSNIVLNELDKFVEDTLIPKYTKGKKRKSSPEYDRLMYQKMKARKRHDYDAVKAIEKQKRQIPICEPNDPNYRRLRYIRYADDFLLGFIGSKAEAQEIKEELGDYLATLGLTMSKEKTAWCKTMNKYLYN
jgi:retron-type reverse transcriptase